MTDRQKIINAIEKAKKQSEEYAQDCIIVPFKEADMILAMLKEQSEKEQRLKTKCIICPHCDNCDVDENGLLKEQEAVEPTFKQDNYGIFAWACGSCGAYMYHICKEIDKAKEYAKYCRQCGRKVKWE